MTVEELKVVISAETSQLKAAMRDVKSSLGSVTGSVKSATKSVENTINKSVKKVTNSFKTLGRTVAKVFSVAVLAKFAKKSIDLASDLEEVQNVVDVSFGKMADSVNEFAKKSMEAFGLSEFAFKRTASTFMAMSNGMGIASSAGKLMATQLTALSGDMASFFNTSEEWTRIALASVFTGETETMKKYGVVLTEANLKAFALSRGIKKSYSEMSQAEKVALRYNYVMKATADAQWDFTRTTNSWANQIRVLRLSWEELMRTVGQILTKVFLPMVKVLNMIVNQLILVANAVAKAFGGTGLELKKDMDGFNDSTNDSTGNLEDANDEAKKLKRTVAGFDELNLLKAPETDDSGLDAWGDISFGLDAPYDLEGIVQEGTIKKSLEELLEAFNNFLDRLNEKLVKIKDTVGNLFNGLGKKLHDALMAIDFDTLAEVFANGFNLILTTIHSFLEGFETRDLGEQLGNAFNRMIETVDWDLLGATIALHFNRIFQFLANFFATVDFTQLGKSLSTSINRIFNDLDFDAIKGTIINGVNGLIETFATVIENIDIAVMVASFTKMLAQAIENIDFEKLGAAIHDGIVGILQGLRLDEGDAGLSIAESLGKALREGLKGLDVADIFSELLTTINEMFKQFFTGLFDNEILGTIAAKITEIVMVLAKIGPIIMSIAGVLATLNLSSIPAFLANILTSFTPFGLAFERLKKIAFEAGVAISDLRVCFDGLHMVLDGNIEVVQHWGNVIKTSMIATGKKIQEVFAVITSKTGLVVMGIAAISAALVYLFETNEGFREAVVTAWGQIKEAIGTVWEFLQEIWEIISPIFETLLESLQSLWEESLEPLLQSLGDLLAELLPIFMELIETILKPIMDILVALAPILEGVVAFLAGALTGAIEGIKNILQSGMQILQGIIDFLTGVFTGDWQGAWDGIVNIVQGVWGTIKGIVGGIIDMIKNAIQAVKELFSSTKEKPDYNFGPNEWNPGGGRRSLEFSETYSVTPIPALAKGGVLTQATTIMGGEYAGAGNNNPEIVSPKSLMRETMEEANVGVINAIFAMGTKVSKAVDDKDMDVYMDTSKVTRKISKEQQTQKRNKGSSLVLA